MSEEVDDSCEEAQIGCCVGDVTSTSFDSSLCVSPPSFFERSKRISSSRPSTGSYPIVFRFQEFESRFFTPQTSMDSSHESSFSSYESYLSVSRCGPMEAYEMSSWRGLAECCSVFIQTVWSCCNKSFCCALHRCVASEFFSRRRKQSAYTPSSTLQPTVSGSGSDSFMESMRYIDVSPSVLSLPSYFSQCDIKIHFPRQVMSLTSGIIRQVKSCLGRKAGPRKTIGVARVLSLFGSLMFIFRNLVILICTISCVMGPRFFNDFTNYPSVARSGGEVLVHRPALDPNAWFGLFAAALPVPLLNVTVPSLSNLSVIATNVVPSDLLKVTWNPLSFYPSPIVELYIVPKYLVDVALQNIHSWEETRRSNRESVGFGGIHSRSLLTPNVSAAFSRDWVASVNAAERIFAATGVPEQAATSLLFVMKNTQPSQLEAVLSGLSSHSTKLLLNAAGLSRMDLDMLFSDPMALEENVMASLQPPSHDSVRFASTMVLLASLIGDPHATTRILKSTSTVWVAQFLSGLLELLADTGSLTTDSVGRTVPNLADALSSSGLIEALSGSTDSFEWFPFLNAPSAISHYESPKEVDSRTPVNVLGTPVNVPRIPVDVLSTPINVPRTIANVLNSTKIQWATPDGVHPMLKTTHDSLVPSFIYKAVIRNSGSVALSADFYAASHPIVYLPFQKAGVAVDSSKQFSTTTSSTRSPVTTAPPGRSPATTAPSSRSPARTAPSTGFPVTIALQPNRPELHDYLQKQSVSGRPGETQTFPTNQVGDERAPSVSSVPQGLQPNLGLAPSLELSSPDSTIRSPEKNSWGSAMGIMSNILSASQAVLPVIKMLGSSVASNSAGIGASKVTPPRDPEKQPDAIDPNVGEAVDVAVDPNVGDAVDVAVDPNVGDAVDVAVDPNVGEAVDVAVDPNVGQAVDVAVDPNVAEAVDVTPPSDPEETSDEVDPNVADVKHPEDVPSPLGLASLGFDVTKTAKDTAGQAALLLKQVEDGASRLQEAVNLAPLVTANGAKRAPSTWSPLSVLNVRPPLIVSNNLLGLGSAAAAPNYSPASLSDSDLAAKGIHPFPGSATSAPLVGSLLGGSGDLGVSRRSRYNMARLLEESSAMTDWTVLLMAPDAPWRKSLSFGISESFSVVSPLSSTTNRFHLLAPRQMLYESRRSDSKSITTLKAPEVVLGKHEEKLALDGYQAVPLIWEELEDYRGEYSVKIWRLSPTMPNVSEFHYTIKVERSYRSQRNMYELLFRRKPCQAEYFLRIEQKFAPFLNAVSSRFRVSGLPSYASVLCDWKQGTVRAKAVVAPGGQTPTPTMTTKSAMKSVGIATLCTVLIIVGSGLVFILGFVILAIRRRAQAKMMNQEKTTVPTSALGTPHRAVEEAAAGSGLSMISFRARSSTTAPKTSPSTGPG